MTEIDLSETLGPECGQLLEGIGVGAHRHGAQSFLVGGLIRDILLGIGSPGLDIDIMFTADAPDIVRKLKSDWAELVPALPNPARLIVFSRYKTAKLHFSKAPAPDVENIDFATARSERYPFSGSRPEVEPGSLESDMARRDFTVNAMCAELTPGNFGRLHDLFDGQRDLEAHELRVLHAQSFVDDPARLLRGARFQARFGFSFEPVTKELFCEAVRGQYLSRIKRSRLFEEFRKALQEPAVGSVLERLDESGLLGQIHDACRLNSSVLKAVDQALSEKGLPWLKLLSAVLGEPTPREFREILASFEFADGEIEKLLRELF